MTDKTGTEGRTLRHVETDMRKVERKLKAKRDDVAALERNLQALADEAGAIATGRVAASMGGAK